MIMVNIPPMRFKAETDYYSPLRRENTNIKMIFINLLQLEQVAFIIIYTFVTVKLNQYSIVVSFFIVSISIFAKISQRTFVLYFEHQITSVGIQNYIFKFIELNPFIRTCYR